MESEYENSTYERPAFERHIEKNGLPKIEETSEARVREAFENDEIDHKYGFSRIKDTIKRTGFLINMHENEMLNTNKQLISIVDYYFIENSGNRFKVSFPFEPYFYILVAKEKIQEISQFLSNKYSGYLHKIDVTYKEDLDLPNHLIGIKQKYLKLSFINVSNLIKVRRDLLSAVRKNKELAKNNTLYHELLRKHLNQKSTESSTSETSVKSSAANHFQSIIDIREHDVPYHVRVSIDHKIFCGKWYDVQVQKYIEEPPLFFERADILERPDLVILAFDIETTKLPLKFPDAATDHIMMISYMINGDGFLINNRQIISADVESFNYTPKPEFKGHFTVYNEPDEKALLIKFFDHIMDVKPNIFVTYNGDFFDWPFVETRGAVYELNMKREIGFAPGRDGVYCSRPGMHMDCLCWVKRDSYLPVGSQNLKAVAKAKLRYDPVELDPEDMCTLAAEQPQVLSNYSVSDAIATYYLYMKYVYPFIFALTTIIPMEPDEVLRKGSGTLCETLLMVEAFHANIIYPNKEEAELNKLTKDGHVLQVETYVGGHVEALESGVFRADIPCRFRLNPSMFDKLISQIKHTVRHAIVEEEKVPMEMVQNLDEICQTLEEQLLSLKNIPNRIEKPIIYHLDVGAMYPNIILTNRLQPTAIVNESICAGCDFNRPNATCKRDMTWTWRGEYMPASRGEYQRIIQQLETEKFPPLRPGMPQRAFHQLTRLEQAEMEKKRLSEYSRKAYGKTKITKVEDRVSTVCQKENSFYVDTVRAFRDRRYEYKAFNKKAKQDVAEAMKKGDLEELKLAKGREIIFDSLQLAHKCILNSFYGYVMRRGARWHSMEMGGIVCYTGAHIIMKAREIIEQVGRPLELDTDGIWCLLPSSFPETFTVHTTHPKKSKMVLSYPNAVLNAMVKDYFTNDQYHELVDSERMKYEKRSENSIFFEVDGPYLAMVLPASKEEGKRLKKRYAVYNFDGSLAELKGFEVKRRGELQLIKIFQSSVFQAFLKGTTLEECYSAVARVANYWLDILFNKGADVTDKELFDLISENRSMSKTLDEYGSQKSTSISTAKRLAEFLGDQMVKDKGLACKFIISKKPEGAPVTERAIPLAIFQSEDAIKHHYLRKWLKDPTIDEVNIREIIDWNYYIERLGGTIQKIITIPAAMQGVSNPVPRIHHPKWLHHKIVEKNDVFKQRKIQDMFAAAKPKTISSDQSMETTDHENQDPGDIEDINKSKSNTTPVRAIVTNSKRKRHVSPNKFSEDELKKSWREALGPPPPLEKNKTSMVAWVVYQKRKWAFQAQQRGLSHSDSTRDSKRARINQTDDSNEETRGGNLVRAGNVTIGGFLKRSQKSLLDSHWQIIQIVETNEAGVYKLWVLVGQELHQIKLNVPRIIFVNYRTPMDCEDKSFVRKCNKILPRGHPVLHLYQYTLPEKTYQDNSSTLQNEFLTPNVEGIYESQVSLEFRAILQLGCVCRVKSEHYRNLSQSMRTNTNTFNLDHLELSNKSYLSEGVCKSVYLYHYKQANSAKAVYGLFLTPSKKALIVVVDTVKTNQMPNMLNLYNSERQLKLEKGRKEADLPPEKIEFEIRVENDMNKVNNLINKALQQYLDEKRGATLVAAQTSSETSYLTSQIPLLNDLPMVKIQIQDADNLFNTLEWQRVGAKNIVRHYLNSIYVLEIMKEQCKYLHIPLGNLPMDTTLFGADLFFARYLARNNFVLWYSPSDKPDIGGHEADDNRLLTDFEENCSVVINKPGCYSTICIELNIEMLAVNTLLQSHHIHDIDNVSGTTSIGFDNTTSVSLDKYMDKSKSLVTTVHDEETLCAPAFRILKAMVNTWLRDISIHKNTFADFQITHFYRWLRSPHALMFEPALRNMLHNLMKKAFIQLIAQFRELGAIIVYGNFNKVVICTKKHTVEESIGYIEFIAQSVRNKEIFHSIDLDYKQCWEFLVWLDLANHAGVKGNLPKGLMTVGDKTENPTDNEKPANETPDDGQETNNISSQIENQTQEEDEVVIAMLWNVVNFLPDVPYVRQNFNSLISYYISNVYQYIQNDLSRFSLSITQTPKRPSTSQGLSQKSCLGLDVHKTAAEVTKKLIKDDLSFKLFKIVQKINSQMPECEAPKLSYINLLNEHKMIKPAVEFIKTICKILSLDSSIEEEVTVLRRNMFRLVGVSDFSDEAEWKNPCISYVLPEIVCQVCNNCRDIDVCQDTFKIIENDRASWFCPECKSQYNTASIEFLLIDSLNKKSMSYFLQDGYCTKCLEVKMKNMDYHCACGGVYQARISQQDLMVYIKTFYIISKEFKMPILSNLCNWQLETIDEQKNH